MTERRFHTDSRAGENFTKDGLETLTGQPYRQWGRYVVKELVDNALEAVEAADAEPKVSVSLATEQQAPREYVQGVSVSDTGNGIPESQLRQIADVETFGGTKRHYTLPTRGTQGNALMTLLGIQHLVGEGPLMIETRGQLYEFEIDDNTIDATPSVSISKKAPRLSADGGVTTGTTVTVQFGDDGKKMANATGIYRTLVGFSTLNPHVTFNLSGTESAAAENTTTRYEPKGSATSGRALWFDRQAFVERLKADIRSAPELPVAEFISEFDGLSSRAKCTSVTESLGVDGDRSIRDVFTNLSDGLDDGLVDDLHAAMRQETTSRSEKNLHKTLGSVGKGLQHGPVAFLDHWNAVDIGNLVDELNADGADVSDWRDLVTYYRSSDAFETQEHRIPFVFELAALPVLDDDSPRDSHFGINGSVSYSAPRASVNYTDTNGKQKSRYSISGVFNDLTHDFIIVSNLTCPNIPFQDKGKQNFPTEPFEDTISDVVGKTVRKYQRTIRPMLNSLEQTDEPEKPTLDDSRKAPRGFIKDAVFSLFDDVYRQATENGKYSIMMRQLFYEMRPQFDLLAQQKGYEFTCNSSYESRTPLELKYETYTDYVEQYESEVLRRRVVRRDDRGFFVEPHSNRRTELSTQKVEQYDPAEAVGSEFDTLLFVEKTGFYEQLHSDFEITKRYDVGLINSQGYSTTAIRSLVEKIQKEAPDTQYLTLTDLDVGGLGIATDADTPDSLSALSSFDAKRLGVTVDDVREFDLQVENVDYNQKELTKLETHHDDGDITDESYRFVSDGNRVEINAFSPTELKTYIEEKLDAHDVSKIEPEPEEIDTPDLDTWEDTRHDAVMRAMYEHIAGQIDDELIEAFADRNDDLELPPEEDRPEADTSRETVHDQLLERLADKPPESWQSVNDDVVDDISDDVTDAQENYADTAEDAAKDVLSDTDIITVDPDSID